MKKTTTVIKLPKRVKADPTKAEVIKVLRYAKDALFIDPDVTLYEYYENMKKTFSIKEKDLNWSAM